MVGGSWTAVGVPFLAAAGLLLVAGLPKIVDPMPLVRALRSAGLPAPRAAVRLAGAAEAVVGGWALLAPGRPSAMFVALAYVAFTAFVVLALTRGGVLASCGCFGKADTPPTRVHAALTGLAVLAAGGVATDPPETAWWSGGAGTLVGTALLVGLVGFLAWQVMAVLPTVTPAAIRSAQKG